MDRVKGEYFEEDDTKHDIFKEESENTGGKQENVQFRGREDGDHLILLYTDWWSDHEGLEMSWT